MSSTHNHEPICCCVTDSTGRIYTRCPACLLHGELTDHSHTQDECPSCHQAAGRPHTDYCQRSRTTLVDTGTMFATITTTPPSHTRIGGEGPTPAEANRDIPPSEHTPPPCPCTYNTGPVQHHPTCPDYPGHA